jgi:enamine deaminase RidA (YjgF/YER057c/UK114 family)
MITPVVTAPSRPPVRDFQLTLIPEKTETMGEFVGRLAQWLKEHEAAIVRQFVFGSLASRQVFTEEMRGKFGNVPWPVTWVEGKSCNGAQISGVQIQAVSGVSVEPLVHGDTIVGRTYDDGQARHCVLGDVFPENLGAPAPHQARETFDRLEAALGSAGMTMKHVVRTWLFLDEILAWYGPFNTVRNDFFARMELRAGMFPASTGVGARNPHRSALVAAAWAIQPHEGRSPVNFIPSPRQCPATEYGSAFSRAVEIISGNARRLLISGTASIAPNGKTLHVGDTRKQMELTMEVVGSILQARGYSFSDAVRGIAYFQSGSDLPLFADWCARNHLEGMLVVPTCCELCRDDLRFELELEAMVETP